MFNNDDNNPKNFKPKFNPNEDKVFNDEDKYIVAEDRLTTVFNDQKVAEILIDEEDHAPQKADNYIVQSQLISEDTQNLSPINISKEMRQSFLDYSMSVICSRALPDARDGLKPVHRRILYSMHEQNMLSQSPHKKSARIVGDVLGNYHPHGDSAVYESMVRMAQNFSMRYPLIDGHGNFGSIDGDEAAAMRYTEARMSKIANFVVESLKKDTVNFVPNYDGSNIEPTVLPTRIPNLLINGTTGIAVGMATSIPPHNLNEVLSGIIALARNNDISIKELMSHIPAPDFPTGALILGVENIKKAYETGKGSVTLRSKTHIEELKNGKKRLVVTEIPYVVNKARLVEKIAELVKTKAIEGITDLRDESSMNGIRIVIDVRRDIDAEVLRNNLFKQTALQSNFPINLLAIVNGVPKVLNLKEICKVFLDHQIEIVTRRSQFDLDKATARAHILEGLKIAIHNIEDIISIIRKSENDAMAHQKLSALFKLSNEQTKAIIDMRLGRLTGLAIEKMNDELNQLNLTISHLTKILTNFNELIDLIIDELNEIKGKFADERRSEISKEEITIHNEDLIPQKDIAITMTSKGYVKRVALEQFQIQNRGGIGSKAITTYEDDDVHTIITTNTHTDLLIFSSFGKVYRLRAHQIPELSKQAKGVPFLNLVNIEKEEKVIALLSTKEYLPSQDLLTVTKQGIIKRTKLSEYSNINISGKKALGLKADDSLLIAMIVKANDDIVIGSSDGNVVTFDVANVRTMGRTASGVKGINLNPKAKVVGASNSSLGPLMLSIGSNGFGKLTPLIDYRKTKRGAKGVKSLNVQKAGALKFVSLVQGHEDLLVTTKLGITIRTSLSQVSHSSRGTKGVKIIALNEGNTIKSIDVINIKQIESEVEAAISKTQELKIENLNLEPIQE